MAPRKAAAASAEGECKCPMLKLTIEKGPLSGQINEFRPGSRIQVGRVVRGNTLSIKEDGISSKHLLIQVDSSSEHWTITDLGSSNGTILNAKPLKPSEPVVLSDGDEIKIGERTSMRLNFEIGRAAVESNGGNVRKNTRRRVRNQAVELGVIPENTELGLGLGLVGENGDIGNEVLKLGTEGEGKVKVRRSQRSKAIVMEDGGETFQGKKGNFKVTDLVDNEENTESVVKGTGGKKVSVRRTRGSRKDEISTDLNVVEQKVSVRRTRSAKNSDMEGNLEVSEIKLTKNKEKSEAVCVRITRSSRKKEELVDLDIIQGKSEKKGGRGKTNVLAEKTSEEEKKEEINVEHEICEGKRNSVALDHDSVIDGEETGREGEDGMAGTSGLQKGDTGTKKGKVLPNLEMMTLGEWFDFLEDYLPQQIIDATEEVISDMKQKAERLHEYKLQQMNAKQKGGEVVE